MLGWIFLALSLAGGIGCMVMATGGRKALGVIPIVLWVIGFLSPLFLLGVLDLGGLTIVVLALQGTAAVLGIVFFQMGRSDKMKREAGV